MNTETPGRRRVHPALWLLIGAGVLSLSALLVANAITASVLESYRLKRERAARAQLFNLASAQTLVKAGTGAYWREDIAGFADVPLVDPRVPLADAGLSSGRDFLGYVFRSLPFSDEATPDPARFALHVFPAPPESFMYVITQDRALWRKKAVAGGVTVFPADPVSAGWVKLSP